MKETLPTWWRGAVANNVGFSGNFTSIWTFYFCWGSIGSFSYNYLRFNDFSSSRLAKDQDDESSSSI